MQGEWGGDVVDGLRNINIVFSVVTENALLMLALLLGYHAKVNRESD